MCLYVTLDSRETVDCSWDVCRRMLIYTTGAQGAGEEGESGPLDGDVMVSGGAPFETQLWRARLAIQRATSAMLAAYEVKLFRLCLFILMALQVVHVQPKVAVLPQVNPVYKTRLEIA